MALHLHHHCLTTTFPSYYCFSCSIYFSQPQKHPPLFNGVRIIELLMASSSSSSSSSSLSDQDQGSSTQPFRWHYTELDDKNFQIHGRSLLLVIILFSLLLLFTFLCLYARWVCRYRRLLFISSSSSTTTTTTTTTTIATATQTDDPIIIPPSSMNSSVVVGGLDPAVIDRLPILLHHRSTKSSLEAESASASDDNDETQCSICLSTFQDQEKVKVLPDCHHTYHPECVDTWLTTQSNCPLCRASLRSHNVDNSTSTPIP